MDKLHFSVCIKAPREKVWNVLWNDATYRSWTNVFSEGSYAVSDWEQGSWILFLTPEGVGVYSLIDRKIPNEVMSFRHMGILQDVKHVNGDEEMEEWIGAMENYLLREKDGITELMVEMDINEKNRKYFNMTFPKALQKIRSLSEDL
jgi:hypothetical protein